MCQNRPELSNISWAVFLFKVLIKYDGIPADYRADLSGRYGDFMDIVDLFRYDLISTAINKAQF